MSTEFANPPIDIAGLPQVEAESFDPVHANYLRAKMVGAALTAAVVVAVTAAATAVARSQDEIEPGAARWVLLAGIGVLALVALGAVLQRLSVKHMGYLMRQHDLTYRYGVVSRTTQTIPYSRVQHVSIDRGPVERRLGLATMRLRSAGGVIAIAGLGVDEATALREVVVSRADVDPLADE